MKVTDLGEKFDLLRSYPACAAYMRRISRCWQGKEVAARLGVAPGTWVKMKKGELELDVAHAALLLDLCGIHEISGSIFYATIAEFRERLEPVALSGRERMGFLYPFWEAAKDTGLQIVRQSTRGITSGASIELTFRIGELVNVEIEYSQGGFITLFEIGPEKIELTVPSLHRTDMALRKGRTVLPGPGKFFTVDGPPGEYWLLAVITDARPRMPTWAGSESFTSERPCCVLKEEDQAVLVAALRKSQQIHPMALPYEVIRSSST